MMTENESQHSRIMTDQMAEYITRVEELAYEIKVREAMGRNPKTVRPELTMRQCLDLFREARISGAPVVSATGGVIGILSIEDLILCMRDNRLDAHVNEYMTTDVLMVRDSDPLVDALKIFVNAKVGRLPVLDGERNLIGILTKGDITRSLLKALQQDYHTEEVRRYRASHLFEDIVSDRTSLILRYNIKAHDFSHAGEASSNIKRALVRLGANTQIARRTGIAVYEAEMNLIIHTTEGGVIRVEIEPHQISIDAYDYGPGIKDIELAMRPGYSTASEEIRELGFGAGMGLVNISRCVDQMLLESTVGKGTRLRMKIYLQEKKSR
ncbi:predicted transcriptional regulator, contains C-terminal CBS domains [Longilinea arvoryzae]|uniref:Predicted transcriptional regulator, contains C-terminal CBS domains n=2 Tax=Longilinea arvoryzae TaxID=360412 RepID=A0A0S7BH46_9CHLR|nr:predicted transcriptional regulator, contains C-terminal CBS domains [Longilinea arvoryzae]